jgi:hypothetical protein
MISATYQIGVDVLGFPIYIQHDIYRGESEVSKFNSKKSFWVSVVEKLIKQY